MASDQKQLICPLGLETHVLEYRAPADQEFAVWVEVYGEGELIEQPSVGVVKFDGGSGSIGGEVRISRLDLRELSGGDDDRLEVSFEFSASGQISDPRGSSWTRGMVDWPVRDLW